MSLAGKTVAVTGGAGFIGSHLVDALVRNGGPREVLVIDNFFLGKESNLAWAQANGPVTVHRFDASDMSSMLELFRNHDIEVLFDLATVPLPTSLRFPLWTVQEIVGVASTVCELARMGHVETVIHCSSSEAYGTALSVPMTEDHPLRPATPYAAAKAAADQIVLSYVNTFGIDAAIVRPFNTFGPRQNDGSYAGIIPLVINRVRQGLDIEIYGDGEQTRDFMFVRDTASSILAAYSSPEARGKVLNVATGVETSVNELVRMLLEVMGVPGHPVHHVAERPGDVRRHCGSVALTQELLGSSPPPISLASLAETVRAYDPPSAA